MSEAERRRVWEFYIGTPCTRLDDKKNGEIWEIVSIPAIANEDKAFQLSDEPKDFYLRLAGEVLHDAV